MKNIVLLAVGLCGLLLTIEAASENKLKGAVYDGKLWHTVTYEKGGGKPPPIASDSWKKPDTRIFVGIAQYRDARCAQTLVNYFTKAKYPERLAIGLVQQVHKDDQDCVKRYCELMGHKTLETCPHVKQIRQTVVSWLEAKGPTFGRHLQSQLQMQGDEDFCMQTDSHMDVVQDWDVKLLEAWALTNNEYAVLSTYVHDFPTLNKNVNNRNEVPFICRIMWNSNGIVRNQQASSAINLQQPVLAPSWGAGLSFSRCHAERKTPYDPQLPQTFDGEEFSKFVRLWTRGYDVYTLHRNYVVHDYTRPKGPNPQGWKKNAQEMERSVTRLKTLFGLPGGHKTPEALIELGKYGLGTKRTLDQLIDFVGVDLRNQKIIGNRCIDLPYVPFEVDPDPEVEVGDIWGMAPAVSKGGWPHIPITESAEWIADQIPHSAAPQALSWSAYIAQHRMVIEVMLMLIPTGLCVVLFMMGVFSSNNAAKKDEDTPPAVKSDDPAIVLKTSGLNARRAHNQKSV